MYLLTYLPTHSFTYSVTHSLTILLANSLTHSHIHSMQQSPSSEANRFSASQEIPRNNGTGRLIAAFTTARHMYLPWATSIQSMPLHPTSWRSILILSSHLLLGLPSGLYPSGFPTKTIYILLLSPIRATWPAHFIPLDLITPIIFGEKYRSLCTTSLLPRPSWAKLFSSNTLFFTSPILRLNSAVFAKCQP